MEADRNLHMFHEFPDKANLEIADRPLYGLELMVERGTGWGPCRLIFGQADAGPRMRVPVQGTPSISGMSGLAAVVVNPCGELGTKKGVHEVVKTVLFLASTGMRPAVRNALNARRLRRPE